MGGGTYGNFGNTKGSTLDALSNLLAVASFIPGVDTVTDLLSIPVDIARGDWLSAGLDLFGVIPFVGEVADTAKIARIADKAADAAKVAKKVSLPKGNSQLKHIFRDVPGHLPDTPTNRKLLTDIANNPKYYRGIDEHGNTWHIKIDNDGQQIWTRSQNGKINNAGKNLTPRKWDSETGLNNNPLKRTKRR